MSPPAAFGALVIGGGIHGLSTAWHLARLGAERVALVEQFRFGHAKGSSHGHSRITRSSYGDALYVELMQHAHGEEWPRLEQACGTPLVHPNDGAYFGPADGPFEDYARAVASVGADVERIGIPEARRRFPLFAFPDAVGVLHDHTGGLIAACDTIEALTRRCWIDGVHGLEETRVIGIDPSRDPVVVTTDRGTLLAERVVITAGAWVQRLVPELAGRVIIKRQHVGYFELDAPTQAQRLGHFPVWAYLGHGENGLRYGLPEFGSRGVKAALHTLAVAPDDPDQVVAPDEAVLERTRHFFAEQLSVPIRSRVHAETCWFTSTASEDFVLDACPGAERVWVGSACSGHGFKFGPLVGRILAELALNGRSTVEPFERHRGRFALARD
ncbi:MAG: FAD-dependent oxidoreductase [Candidatus Eisenbacteria bacterium]